MLDYDLDASRPKAKQSVVKVPHSIETGDGPGLDGEARHPEMHCYVLTDPYPERRTDDGEALPAATGKTGFVIYTAGRGNSVV